MTAAPTATPAAAAPAQSGNGCLPRGFRLREFVIERVLGDGGFGVVYSALDLRLERRVAIKEYMPSSLARRDTDYSVQMLTSKRHRDAFEVGLRSFINEARMLARFEHPALIKVHQFWQEKGTAYMVMPFYAAPTLRTWVRSQQQPVTEAWLRGFLLRAMEAVEVLHAESCLHRDIAPDNILVMKDANPLLLDFGAARRVIGDLRKALTVIVKPGFAPLEQYADTVKMKQGPWTDVYALAAVGHFIITGHPPAPAVSRVLADEVVPLRERAKGRYSDALLGALDTALAVKPERRPQSIAAFRALLLSTQPGEWEPTRLIRRASADATVQPTLVAEPGDFLPSVQPAPAQSPVRVDGAAARATLAPAPKSFQPTAAPITVSPTAVTPSLRANTVQRSAGRFVDMGTLTQAVRDSISPTKEHSRWVGIAGYALALLAFGAVLMLTAQLVERYVESSARGATAPVVSNAAPVAAQAEAPAISKNLVPVTDVSLVPVAQAAAAAAAHVQPSATGAMAEARPSEVTLAPARIDAPATVVTPAPVAAQPVTPPARPAAKPKATVTTKVAIIERAPRETGKAALLLTAQPPAPATNAAATPSRVKTRGMDELVVPLERAADIADVAKVELVVAAPPDAVKVAAPLRAIARPQPQFPLAALKEGVRDGRVLAEVTVNSDGTVGQVEIVEARPRNVFEKEVRRALAGWRYDAPGQPRQASVEFVFKLDE